MSDTALTTESASSLRAVYTDDQIELIKKTCADGLTDLELKLFLYQCQRTGLDPLSRQIHAVKRQGKLVIQTGIDGYTLVADRTGLYAGSDDAIYDSEEGKQPRKATVTVWKMVGGQRVPFTRSARWSEFFPGDKQGFMWNKMPYHMLGKCATALALRAAFPQELSGVYTHEEMQQADAEPRTAPEPPQLDEASAAEIVRLLARSGRSWAKAAAFLKLPADARIADLSDAQYARLKAKCEDVIREKAAQKPEGDACEQPIGAGA